MRTKRTKKTKRTKRTKLMIGGNINKKIERSLYPFWYGTLPFPSVSNDDLLEEKTWKQQLDLASDLYKNKSPLAKKTILFHGSHLIDPIKDIDTNSKVLVEESFFGLDAFIAIWFISELKFKSDLESLLARLSNNKKNEKRKIKELEGYDTSKWKPEELAVIKKRYDDEISNITKKEEKFTESVKELKGDWQYPKLENFASILNDIKLNDRRYYFLNIYETQEDIPYKYLDKSIRLENPYDNKECNQTACMHPQFGYHEIELNPPVELSLEFSIPPNQIGNKLKLVGVYVIDVFKLYENKEKTFPEFKATEAIVLKTLPYSQMLSKSKSKSKSKSSSRKVKSI